MPPVTPLTEENNNTALDINEEIISTDTQKQVDLNSNTKPLSNTQNTPVAIQASQATNVSDTKQKNLISDIQLIPVLLNHLTVPTSQVLAMTLPLAEPNPVVLPSEYVLQHHWEIGLIGLYAHKATGSGVELLGGYRRELSKNLSAHFLFGGGCIDISNPATLGDLDNLTSEAIEIDRGPDTGDTAGDPEGPAGPAGAAGPQGDGMEGGNMGDVGFDPGIPDLELTSAQLRSLSLSNISSVKYLTANTGIELAVNRHLEVGTSLGLDYILSTSFNEVYIENDKFLTLDGSNNSGLTNIELEEGHSLLTFAEAYSRFNITETLSLKAGYKYYFKAIFPALGKNWLNQFRLGFILNLRGKNK